MDKYKLTKRIVVEYEVIVEAPSWEAVDEYMDKLTVTEVKEWFEDISAHFPTSEYTSEYEKVGDKEFVAFRLDKHGKVE